jgi:hypothetical protein
MAMDIETMAAQLRTAKQEEKKMVKSGAPIAVVFTPLYGTPEAATVPLNLLHVHTHPDPNDPTKTITGGDVKIVDGKGFIKDAAWAKWIESTWGNDGYKVEYNISQERLLEVLI